MTKGRPPEPRSPQEKKALSLKKDRRDNYFASAKASRRLVPLAKARAQRKTRHAADQALTKAIVDGDAALDLAESSIREETHRVGGWRKDPHGSLAEDIARNELARTQRDGRKNGNRKPGPDSD